MAGTNVTIRGTNLVGLTAVRFGQALAAVQSASTNELVVTVPDDALTASINVIGPGGIVATTNFFGVPPTIRQFSRPTDRLAPKSPSRGRGLAT